jgi:Tol biopolymer transport system component
MADEHASFQEVTVVSLKTIARFCSMLLLLALILTSAGSVHAMPGNTIRVSVASDGTQSNHDSYNPSISADGRFVAFESEATNLVSGDTNNFRDIFVHDRQTGQTTRVSVASDGTQSNQHSYNPSISADGRYVAFESEATNLVSGDTNNHQDIFVHDRQTGQTTRVSVASDGTQANDYSYNPSISADGRYVAFISYASNLVGGDTEPPTQPSTTSLPNNPASKVTGGVSQVFVHDRQTGATTLVSVAIDGSEGNDHSEEVSISADGRYVAFASSATNLVSGDTNKHPDIFVRDLQTNQTTRVSVASDGTQANNFSFNPSISADGRYVAFTSWANNLVSGDTNGGRDIFVHDRQTGATTRVSVATGGGQAAADSQRPSISADGRYVAFESDASNLVSGDTNNHPDIFVHDRQTGVTMQVSVASDGTQTYAFSSDPSISADGRYVAFGSEADNLVSGDTNGRFDIFVREMNKTVVFLPLIVR